MEVLLEHLEYSDKNHKLIVEIVCKQTKKNPINGPGNIDLAQFDNGQSDLGKSLIVEQ